MDHSDKQGIHSGEAEMDSLVAKNWPFLTNLDSLFVKNGPFLINLYSKFDKNGPFSSNTGRFGQSRMPGDPGPSYRDPI